MDTLRNLELPGTPPAARIRLRDASWSVRLSRASMARTALELHVGEGLVDVVVPTVLVSAALRGACSAADDDRHLVTLAWGTFEPGREGPPQVTFRRRRMRGSGCRGETFALGGRFWISAADGRFTEVTVMRADGGVERRAVLAAR